MTDERHGGDDASWVAGLMRENYDAVGFIPEPTVRERYVEGGRAILQRDERGRRVGYLLHGAIAPGNDVVISQSCIDIDSRLRGYGEHAVRQLLDRAERQGVRAVRLRCAEDLPAREFWEAMGFRITMRREPNNRRRRGIWEMRRDLWIPLWEMGDE